MHKVAEAYPDLRYLFNRYHKVSECKRRCRNELQAKLTKCVSARIRKDYSKANGISLFRQRCGRIPYNEKGSEGVLYSFPQGLAGFGLCVNRLALNRPFEYRIRGDKCIAYPFHCVLKCTKNTLNEV